ncbi:MAG: alpha/beta fold hydrolase [Verrucomicrobiota bacterium]
MVTPAPLPAWLAREYPFTPQAFTTPAGARLSYLDEGPRADEAVLMLHGNPTWSFYYRRLVRDLAPTHRCIVPDHVGMGLSARPGAYDYTLATRIADLEALVAALGVKRVHLVVHDWGGAIGFGFAARHPELIGRIVVLNTAAFASPRLPFRIAVCRWPGLGPLLVRGCNGFAGPATWMAMHRRPLTPVERRGYLFPYGSWDARAAVSAFVQDIPREPGHRSWAALAAAEAGLAQFRDRPVLIAWGGRDFCFNDTFLVRWREVFPQARCERFADAGHYVLEDAADEVIPLIRAHLAK